MREITTSSHTQRTLRLQNLKMVLRLDSGLKVGTLFPLDQGRHLMGRLIEAQIPLEDTRVSREHAVIDEQNGFYLLSDLGSTNGTFVNDNRVTTPVTLKVGDRIRIGQSVFILDLLDHAKTKISKKWVEKTGMILLPKAVIEEQEKKSSDNFMNHLEKHAQTRKAEILIASMIAVYLIATIVRF